MSPTPSQPHTTNTDSRGSRRTRADSNRRRSTRRLYDGVVASYLHDISGHRGSVHASQDDHSRTASETAASRVGTRSIPRG